MSGAYAAEKASGFDRWFSYPKASAPSVSHDGHTVYLISDRSGLPHAWAIGRDGGPPRPFFGGSERVARVAPRPDAAGTIVAIDRGGNEHWQLVLTDADGRVVRAITDEPSRIHTPGAWGGRGVFYFSANARDPRFFDLWSVDVHAQESPRPRRTEDALVDVADARDGTALLIRSNTNIDRDLLLFDGGTDTNLLPHDGELAVFDAAFGADRVYAAANPDREFTALCSLRRSGGGPELLASFDGDVERLCADPTGRTVLVAYNDRGFSRLALVDLASSEVAEVDLPADGVVSTLAHDRNGREFFFDLSGPTVGTELFALGTTSASVRQISTPALPFPGPKVRPEVLDITASDALRVPFWWYEPDGPVRGTVVYVHGGPEAQARPGFSPLFGFLLEEGFRLIVPNVRGSLGYGRTYLHLDDVRRRMDSVRDLRDVVEAIRGGRTRVPFRPDERIGVIGGSYGGFMVLSAISTYPDLFDAAIDVVGIANFVTFLERTGPWRRKVREDEYGSLANDREFLESISPLHHADRIVTPLMVVHGENDPRVPLFEAEQIVGALRRRQVPVEFLTYGNEGHGLVRRENQRDAYVRGAEFFARHLARRPGGAS